MTSCTGIYAVSYTHLRAHEFNVLILKHFNVLTLSIGWIYILNGY